MSFSFTFPHKPLLHKRIEDQWFDRSPKETQSTLTTLEAAEEAYAQRLAKITTPDTPPIVLGRAQHQNSVLQQQQQQQQQQLAHATAEGRSNSPAQLSRNRRSRSSSDTDGHSQAHTHDPSDDVSTVVNPSARNRGQASHQQQHHQHQHQDSAQAAMFWNRTRSRRSAGGDR